MITEAQTKLKTLRELYEVIDDGLTKDDFEASFSLILAYIKKIEDKINAEIDTLREKHTDLSQFEGVVKTIGKIKDEVGIELEALKETIQTDNASKLEKISSLVQGDINKTLTKILKEHRSKMNLIDVKIATIKNGEDGEAGKDADEEKIVATVLSKIPPVVIPPPIIETPEQTRDKLESLTEGNKLTIPAIEDLAEILERLEKRLLAVGSARGQAYGSIRTRYIDDETPTGTINGSNTIFTISKSPITGSLKVYRGGARQRVTEDYTLSNRTITFTVAPVVGEVLLCDFRY